MTCPMCPVGIGGGVFVGALIGVVLLVLLVVALTRLTRV